MPKVPQVFSSGDTGGVPGGAKLNPSGFGELATSGTRRAAGELDQASRDYNRVYQTLRAEDEKLDAERAMGEAQRQFADAEIELRKDTSITADQYPQAVERQLKDIREGVGKTLKYPNSRMLFERGMERFGTQQTIKAKYEGLERMHSQVKSTTDLALREDENAAVYSPTPELRAQAQARGLGRIQNLLDQRILSGDEANAKNAGFLARVEQGGIRRDFKDPAKAPLVIANLREGKYTYLSPEGQHDLANGLELEARQEDEKRKKAIKDAEKEVGDEAEKSITDLLQLGNFEAARGVLKSARKFLTGEQYAKWNDTITTRQEKGAPSDPDVAKAMRLEVFSIKGDPAAEQRAATAARDKVQDYYRTGKLDDKDYQNLIGHVNTRLTRSQDQQLTGLGREHAQAEQMITTALQVNGPAAAILDAQAQDLKRAALEDLSRNSAYLGQGNESPLRWYERRKAFYMSQLDNVASQAVANLERRLDYPDVRTLMANKARYRQEADFYDQLRMLRDRDSLLQNMGTFKTRQPGGGGGGGNAGGAPTQPAQQTSGGNTLGR